MNDLSRTKELADAARGLLADKAFTESIKELRKRWFDELMAAEPEAALLVRERIRALEGIPAELQIMVNDYKMAGRRG